MSLGRAQDGFVLEYLIHQKVKVAAEAPIAEGQSTVAQEIAQLIVLGLKSGVRLIKPLLSSVVRFSDNGIANAPLLIGFHDTRNEINRRIEGF
jgi:hypothetical protein